MSNIRFSDICKKEVKAKAAGMWDRIIQSLAPSISSALDHPGLVHIDCPMHGGSGDFRVYRDVVDSGGGVCTCGNWPDGIALIGAVNDWTFKDSLSEIGRMILGDKPELTPVRREARKRDTAREDAAIRQRLVALWNGGRSIKSAEARLVWMYLVGRGLKLPRNLQSVRFHPSMAYYEKGELVGHFPGFMACVMAPDGTPVTMPHSPLPPRAKGHYPEGCRGLRLQVRSEPGHAQWRLRIRCGNPGRFSSGIPSLLQGHRPRPAPFGKRSQAGATSGASAQDGRAIPRPARGERAAASG